EGTGHRLLDQALAQPDAHVAADQLGHVARLVRSARAQQLGEQGGPRPGPGGRGDAVETGGNVEEIDARAGVARGLQQVADDVGAGGEPLHQARPSSSWRLAASGSAWIPRRRSCRARSSAKPKSVYTCCAALRST